MASSKRIATQIGWCSGQTICLFQVTRFKGIAFDSGDAGGDDDAGDGAALEGRETYLRGAVRKGDTGVAAVVAVGHVAYADQSVVQVHQVVVPSGITEDRAADIGYTGGTADGGQAGAAVECRILDSGDTGRDVDTSKAGAAFECRRPDFGDAAADDDAGEAGAVS